VSEAAMIISQRMDGSPYDFISVSTCLLFITQDIYLEILTIRNPNKFDIQAMVTNICTANFLSNTMITLLSEK